MTPADGSGPIDVTGIASLERLERGPSPAQAKYPTPPEPDWQLSFGPMVEGPGSGIVAAMAPRCDTTCDLTEVPEFATRPSTCSTATVRRPRASVATTVRACGFGPVPTPVP